MGGLNTKQPDKASCDIVAVCCVKATERKKKSSVSEVTWSQMNFFTLRKNEFDAV